MTVAILLAALALGPKVETDVVYAKVGERELKLDLYMPEGQDGPVPCVVVVHGGAWISGNKRDMAPIAAAIAKAGMAAASIEYRLAPKDRWPAQIEDCRAAVRFLRTKAGDYGLAKDRFGSCGASAGGHLALLLGMLPEETPDAAAEEAAEATSTRTQAVFNIFGPTDMANDFAPNLRDMLSNALLGKPFDQAGDFVAQFSPVTYVSASAPPVFTLHGDADSLVPVQQSRRLDEAMQKAGAKHELRIVAGMGHALPADKPEVVQAIADGIEFLKRHLSG
jgi:acetyl esterase/lipase